MYTRIGMYILYVLNVHHLRYGKKLKGYLID